MDQNYLNYILKKENYLFTNYLQRNRTQNTIATSVSLHFENNEDKFDRIK